MKMILSLLVVLASLVSTGMTCAAGGGGGVLSPTGVVNSGANPPAAPPQPGANPPAAPPQPGANPPATVNVGSPSSQILLSKDGVQSSSASDNAAIIPQDQTNLDTMKAAAPGNEGTLNASPISLPNNDVKSIQKRI
uniref:Uncharacterized protein n=1 Tax=Romanomermis culicivorax TaxID=13658 RepID=A0A915LA08_ROMCU